MWENPVVQEIVQTLEKRGWKRVGPESGLMACGSDGAGRMSEPAAILEAINQIPV
jgi:phosphopantothenoylcysteine decarboxylase/phosphopantothenate--cysteine ligase